MASEPILRADGSRKNDCERNAVKRLLRENPHLKLLVDVLASNGPHIHLLVEPDLRYVLEVKPGDHGKLFHWANVTAATRTVEMDRDGNRFFSASFGQPPIRQTAGGTALPASFGLSGRLMALNEIIPMKDGTPPHFKKKNCSLLAVVTAVSLMIAGCGGGGGAPDDVDPPNDGASPQTRPVSPPPGSGPPPSAAARNALKSVYRQHMGFARQPAYGQINADEAYVNLEVSVSSTLPTLTDRPTVRPGAGVSIGLVDSGIDPDHPTFSGASIREVILSGDGDLVNTDYTDFSHGTAVAGVIASVPTAPDVKPNSRFGGLAWGADITMYAVQLEFRRSPGLYNPISLRTLRSSDAELAGELRRAIDDGIDFLNMSIGYQGLIENYDEQVLRNRMARTIATMDPARPLNINNMIVVRSAGNVNNYPCGQSTLNCHNGKLEATSPEVHGGLPARIPELREVWVVVVSVDRNGEISSFSNRCGIAKDWCIAAPGSYIYTAYTAGPGQTVRTFHPAAHGTSFSASMVTGGLALMKQVFRGQLSHLALLRRLYATADKTGRYANKEIYGQGLMDLGQATRPLGQQTVATGTTVDDGGLAFMNTGFQVGGAFGDGIVRGFAGQEIVVFDSLGSPFWYTLSGLVRNRSGGALADRLARWEQVDSSWNETEAGLSFSTDIQGGMGNAGERGNSWRFGRLRMHADSGIGPLSLAEGALVLGYGSKRFSWDAYTSNSRQVCRVSNYGGFRGCEKKLFADFSLKSGMIGLFFYHPG